MSSFKRLASVGLLAWSIAGATMTASAEPSVAALRNRDASGAQLAEAFFGLLSRTGSPTGVTGTTPAQDAASRALVRPYLNAAFQSQQASGERYDAAHYMPTDIDAFAISAVHQTRPAPDLIVVRYAVSTPGATAPDRAVVLADAPAPRLTVFRWNATGSRWQVLSHANFNAPLAAICDAAPVRATAVASGAVGPDRELGTALARRWFDLLEAGDGRPIMHPQIQGQSAGGQGYTTAAAYRPGSISAVGMIDPVVTRDGRVMVVSLTAQADRTLFGGTEALGNRATPRLLTFLEDEDGKWSLIATATFNPPRDLPAGAACIRAN
jgi:hypothetical protein